MFEKIIDRIKNKTSNVAEIDLSETGREMVIQVLKESKKNLEEEHDKEVAFEDQELQKNIINLQKEYEQETFSIRKRYDERTAQAKQRFSDRVNQIKAKYLPEIKKFEAMTAKLEKSEG